MIIILITGLPTIVPVCSCVGGRLHSRLTEVQSVCEGTALKLIGIPAVVVVVSVVVTSSVVTGIPAMVVGVLVVVSVVVTSSVVTGIPATVVGVLVVVSVVVTSSVVTVVTSSPIVVIQQNNNGPSPMAGHPFLYTTTEQCER